MNRIDFSGSWTARIKGPGRKGPFALEYLPGGQYTFKAGLYLDFRPDNKSTFCVVLEKDDELVQNIISEEEAVRLAKLLKLGLNIHTAFAG